MGFLKCACLALLCAGCAQTAKYAEGGYAYAFGQAPERSAGVANLMGGLSVRGSASAPVGMVLGGALRTKWSSNVEQVAVAPWMRVFLWFAYVDGGVDLLTVESIAQQQSTSIGSPFVGIGFHVFVTHDVPLTLGATFEYDLRFNSIPNTGYVSFTAGVGGFGNLFKW